MADRQEKVRQEVKKQPVMGKVMDGLLDGLTSVISHGSAEAAAALFAGSNAFIMYGPGLNSERNNGNQSNLASLEGVGSSLSSLEQSASQEQDLSNGMER